MVGASLAGLSTARALRAEGFDGRLVLVGDEVHRPYDRPPLSKTFLAGGLTEADLTLECEDEDLGIEWRLGQRAVALDCAGRSLALADGSFLRADDVVLATGATPRLLLDQRDLSGVHVLRTVDDAVALRTDLLRARHLVVVGAGFVGAEVACTARGLGLDVTVVEAQPTPLAGPLGVSMGAVVAGLHADHGVRLLCGVGVDRLTGTGTVDGVLLSDGTHLVADVVLVGIGARPSTDWLATSGLEMGNGVRCDGQGRTSAPGVFAVGDCASWRDEELGVHRRIEHWTAAVERSPVVARALLGDVAPTGPPKPAYFWSDQYGVRLQFAGHAGPGDTVTVVEGSVEERSFLAVYHRGERPVAVLGMNQVRTFTRWRRRLAVDLALEPS